jgi:hypothetical protein
MAREDAKTSRLYDRRTVDRSIKKGLITRKDYEKHLKSLDDVAEKGVYGGSVDDVDDDVDDDIDDADDDVAPAGDVAPPTNNQGH